MGLQESNIAVHARRIDFEVLVSQFDRYLRPTDVHFCLAELETCIHIQWVTQQHFFEDRNSVLWTPGRTKVVGIHNQTLMVVGAEPECGFKCSLSCVGITGLPFKATQFSVCRRQSVIDSQRLCNGGLGACGVFEHIDRACLIHTSVDACQRHEGLGVVGVEACGAFIMFCGTAERFERVPSDKRTGQHEVFERFEVFGRRCVEGQFIIVGQLCVQCCGDGSCDITLHVEDVGGCKLPVIYVCPDVIVVRCVNELYIDSDLITGTLYLSLENRRNTQQCADFGRAKIWIKSLDRCTRYDLEFAELGQQC